MATQSSALAQTHLIQRALREGVWTLTIANPPVNALSIANGLVGELKDAIEQGIRDPAVTAILVQGEGRMFCGGADIADFDGDPKALGLVRLLAATIEQSPKPVVAAIHGMALGGGLELAVACHYRVAETGATFGLPEVSLGILPGNGGTQRLPRLVGAARALEMMLSGKAIGAEAALESGLIDAILSGPLTKEAMAFAQGLGGRVRPTSALQVPETSAGEIRSAREHLAKKRSLSRAPAHIVDCVEAAVLRDWKTGLAIERALFEELVALDASQGLRHAFFGQRQVAKIPGIASTARPLAIGQVAIVGAGLMGTGIATAILNADLPVTLIEPRGDALDKAVSGIARTIRRDAERGRISSSGAEARIRRLVTAPSPEAAASADLVIEAVFEDLGVKRKVFEALDAVVHEKTILASNTSTLNLDAIAGFSARPERVIGLHFFSPANIMKLLEIVRGEQTDLGVLATALTFAKRIGKVGVVAGVCDGFIGNRIFEEYLRQAYQLLEEGALPNQVDSALEAWGMAMGPLRTMDLAGQDIGWSIRKRRAIEQPDRPYSRIPDLICELGRYGQKTGAGFYLYRDGRTAEADPEIDRLVVQHSAEIGIERRTISDDEIVARCILAMVNEGAKAVEEGIAYRPVDVDIVYINGYGFPAERGGPMFYADRLGLAAVLKQIRAFSTGRSGWSWAPALLLERLAERGDVFASLNR